MNSLPLPQEFPERVRFFNDVFGVDRRLEFMIGQTEYRLRFNPEAKCARPACCCQVIGSESGELRVSLSNMSVLSDLHHWLDGACLADVPMEIALLVLSMYLADTLETMESQLGESFSITETWNGLPADELDYELPFVLSNDADLQSFGVLQFEASWVPTIHTLTSLAPSVVSIDLNELRLPGFVELGRSTLTLSELRTLRTFDVVMLEESQYLSSQRVMVTFPSQVRVQCRVGESTLVVEDVFVEREPCLSSSSRELVDREGLSLPVSVHAGLVEPTLAEMQSVSPGDEWGVTVNDAQTVDLLVTDNVIGRGELIRTGERLGVRLLNLAESSVSSLLSPSLALESI